MFKVFAVRDIRADLFFTPYFLPTEGQAIRGFADEISSGKEDSLLCKHPGDFELYYIGEFDETSGTFSSLDERRQVCAGVQFVKQ